MSIIAMIWYVTNNKYQSLFIYHKELKVRVEDQKQVKFTLLREIMVNIPMVPPHRKQMISLSLKETDQKQKTSASILTHFPYCRKFCDQTEKLSNLNMQSIFSLILPFVLRRYAHKHSELLTPYLTGSSPSGQHLDKKKQMGLLKIGNRKPNTHTHIDVSERKTK